MRKGTAMTQGLCVLALAGLLAGCAEEPAAPVRRKYRIALVMKSLANEFFQTMEKGAREHQRKNADHYELIVNGMKNETDFDEQIAVVEQMVAQKVHALVIAPADSKALVPACKKAQDQGLVVINIDNKLDDDTLKEKGLTIPFFGPNNRRAARLAGEHLAKKLKPGDQVAIVEGLPNAINGVMRKLGFQEAMEVAGAKVAAQQTGRWETDEAEKVVAGMITQHPELKAVLCANDSMAIGAVVALGAAGKLGSVLVVGYDNISAIQQYIKDGKVLCTIDQHADRIAIAGINAALDVLQGRPSPAYQETPVDLVTVEELK